MEIEVVPTGAKYNDAAGSFVVGSDPSKFTELPLGEASGRTQRPLVEGLDETDPVSVALAARRQQTKIAMIQAAQKDPDYLFYKRVAGVLGFQSLDSICETTYAATELQPGSLTVTPAKKSATAPTPPTTTLNSAPVPGSIGGIYEIRPNVQNAVRAATDEIAKATQLHLHVPVRLQDGRSGTRILEQALKQSDEVTVTYLQLIAGIFSETETAMPTQYKSVAAVNEGKAMRARALNQIIPYLRWADGPTESRLHGGELLLDTKPVREIRQNRMDYNQLRRVYG